MNGKNRVKVIAGARTGARLLCVGAGGHTRQVRVSWEKMLTRVRDDTRQWPFPSVSVSGSEAKERNGWVRDNELH